MKIKYQKSNGLNKNMRGLGTNSEVRLMLNLPGT
jgi:hypothetical protein